MSNDIESRLGHFLRAQNIVDSINKNLPMHLAETKPLPADYVFKELDRDAAGVSLMATFEALGGVPGFIFWAGSDPKNQGKVYEWFMKQIPTSQQVEHSGALTVTTSIPDSPLDDRVLNSQGFVGDDEDEA